MRRKSGVILLEVMLALAIVAVAGAALLALSAGSLDAITRGIRSEVRMREASAFLSTVSLWPAEDLDRRLGARAQGKYTLVIQRPSPALYEVALLDGGSQVELLRTVLFRPGERR